MLGAIGNSAAYSGVVIRLAATAHKRASAGANVGPHRACPDGSGGWGGRPLPEGGRIGHNPSNSWFSVGFDILDNLSNWSNFLEKHVIQKDHVPIV